MTIAIRASSKDTVLLLDPEFERRIEAAARLIGIDPAEFIARAVQHRCADVLGEAGPGSGSAAHASASTGRPAATNDAHGSQAFDQRRNGPWAIRPTPDRVLRTIAEASRLSIETVVGPRRGRVVACARAVAAFLLCNDAGLSQKETARIIHRKSARVVQLARSVAQVADSTDPQAELLARARRLLEERHKHRQRLSAAAARDRRRQACAGPLTGEARQRAHPAPVGGSYGNRARNLVETGAAAAAGAPRNSARAREYP
jgi:hypothetical protein